MNFTDNIAIQIQQPDGFHSLNPVRPIGLKGPPCNVVVPAPGVCDWGTDKYDTYGMDQYHYPIYLDNPATACTSSCLFHIQSTSQQSYTIQDFFDIWSYHHVAPDYVVSPQYSATNGMQWEMCTAINGGGAVQNTQWGNAVLQPNTLYQFVYYNATTSRGCA
jgi:hypothetical protein